jgi:hypothetical protein
MNITLTNPTTARITWPSYDFATEAEIARRLKTVPGMTGTGQRWYVSVIQVARLMELFPRASFDYAAIRASDGLARTFCQSMALMGVELSIDDSGAVCAAGENVTPVLCNLVAERAHALKPLVAAGLGKPKPRRQAIGPMHGPLTTEDARLEPWMDGVRNAAKKDAVDAVKYPKRRRYKKSKQKELGT